MDPECIRIPEYFAGKNVFITGGSGFIGKVLIEKLLRSCPDLGNIYMLLKDKKGKNAKERLTDILNLPCFEPLKNSRPDVFKKIIPISGDITEIGLGISEKDRNTIVENTHVIYNAGASVKFNDSLKSAIIVNVRSTREIVELAKEIKQLEVLSHISTTYCNTHKRIIEEKVYPPPADWRELIKVAESVDSFTMDIFMVHLIGTHHPNTYTFTKALAEHVANDLCQEYNIPLVIYRPSIVVPSFMEPVRGWLDNLNGPAGIIIGAGKGVVRTMYCKEELLSDFVVVDIVVRLLIATTWRKGTTKDISEKAKASVYNASNRNLFPITNRHLKEVGMQINDKLFLENPLWYPRLATTACWYMHYFRTIVYCLVPAILVDLVLPLLGYPPIAVRVQKKIYTTNMALTYFLLNEWEFLNDKLNRLNDTIAVEDSEEFGMHVDRIEMLDYITHAFIGGKKYFLREDMSDEAQVRTRRTRRLLTVLDILLHIVWYYTIFYILYYKVDIVGLVLRKLEDIYYYFIRE